MKNVDRLTRINELLKRELSDLFRKELILPAGILVSVIAVKCSVDLRTANVFISIFGGDADVKKSVFNDVKRKRADFQRTIGHNLAFKNTPVLSFKIDDRIEKGDRIFELLEDEQ